MADEKPETTTWKTLTPLEFGKARRLWEMGSVTLKELSEEFGVREQSLFERLKRAGSVKGSRVSEVLEKMDAAVSDEAEIAVRRIADTKEQHYRYAEAVAKMTMQTILNARTEGKKIATVDGDLAALHKAAKTFEVVRKERYKLLGLEDDGADPNEVDEILITEMTQEQIEQLRDAAKGNVDNSEGIDALLDDIEIVDETDLDGSEQ